MTKQKRKEVHRRYDGHCAYCGKTIKYSEMQVDHLIPLARWRRYAATQNLDDISNLMPTCRRCNHYKRAYSIEEFRHLLKTIHERIRKTYIAKVAIDFGIIEFKPFDGVFYYESCGHRD